MDDVLMPIVVIVAVSAALYFFNRGSTGKARVTGDGLTELKINKLYLLIGGAGLLVSIMWLLMPILADEYTSEIFIASGIMFLVFGGFSVLMLLWYRNHMVKFDAVALTVTDAYGITRQVNWDKVKKIEFNYFSGLLTLSDNRNNKFKMHQHLVGFASLLRALQVQAVANRVNCDELPLKIFDLK